MVALALATAAGLAPASVFYKFDVVAESGVAGFTTFGDGPSINNKGKVAFVGKFSGGESIYLWTPVSGVTDISPSFHSPNRTFFQAVRINGNDEVGTVTRNLPSALHEFRVFRSQTPDDNSVMVKGVSGTPPYDLLYPYPWINNTKVLEDRFMSLAGNKDGVCDAGETCVSQIAFNALRSLPNRYLGTVVQNPFNASDPGVQHEFGMNTSLSRPVIADDGRVLVRARNATDPILLFNYALSTQAQIAGASDGFTVLGQAPGMTKDGKVIAFAGNRGHGDGIFLSIQLPLAGNPRRLVRIVGENASYEKAELGFDGGGSKIFMQSIDVDSRVGVTYTPDAHGNADGSVVVSFIGTPSAASRTNPGNGKPFVFSAQKGLWTIRIDLTAPLYMNMCVVSLPGSGLPALGGDDQLTATSPPYIDAGPNGICETTNTDGTETLFSRTSPIPVVQIGDTIKSPTATHIVSALAVHDPIAAADLDIALGPRVARVGDHRVVFWAQAGGNQLIVAGHHLDSDQDGLLDHWETDGIDLTGTGTIDLDLPAMGANPFTRDLFVQFDWAADRATPLNPLRRHPPSPGVIRRLEQFYAAAPALTSGVPAGIKLHVDAGAGLDSARQPFSRNMGAGPLRGGKVVSATPIDILYFGTPGSVNLTGVNAIAFDTVKAANLWAFDSGARELAFLHIVFADFHHATGPGGDDNVSPFTGTVTSATANGFTDSNQNFTTSALGGGVKITGGTGAGQVRSITGLLLKSLDVTVPWNVMPDATSTYVIFDGSSGEGQAGERYDGSFSPGTSLAITLGTFPPLAPGNELGSFLDQWQTLTHEMGHLLTLKHGGVDHANFKAGYFSVMNYAYQLCPPGPAKDGSGNPIPGALPCPVASYAGISDPIFNDWENIDRKSALNFQRVGQAFGAEIDPLTSPFPPPRETETFRSRENRFGPPDVQAPAVTITSPANGVVVVQGNTITVSFTATDSAGITNAEVFFDVNGDGVVNDATEVIAATLTGPNTYSATVPALSGPSTARALAVMAYDPTGNPGVATLTVQVGSARPPVLVPNVVNQPQPAAAASIGALNLVVGTVTQQPSATVAAGSIISQIPAPGVSVPVLTAIDLVLSSGNTTVIVPNGVGMTQANASSAMTAVGLTVGAATMLPSSTVPSGSVISQLPLAGSQVAAAATVSFVVSTGPGNVLVPNVTNLEAGDAIATIVGTGLVVGSKTTQLSATVPAGVVISQSPPAGGSVAAGTTVNLTISSGDATVSVPQLVGRTQAAATAAIGDYGLVVGTITMQSSSTVTSGSVISQSPLAGATTPFGSAVDLIVSTGPPSTSQRTAVSPKGSDANLCSFASPCRSFDRAISRTQSGGEVIVLASAGYGPMVIDRPITIAASAGVYAGISVAGGTGIVVNPGSGRVTLKGLSINGLGGARGIDLQSGDALYVTDCTVSGFTQAGLYAQPPAASSIYVRNSAFRDNATGISTGLAAAGLLQLNLEGAQFEGNGTGMSIVAFGAIGTLRASVFVNNGTGLSVAPVASGASAQLDVSKTTFKGSGTGIVTGGVAGTTATINVTSSLIASSTVGLSSAAGGTTFVADTSITRNVTGLQQTAGGTCVTFGNNRLVNNTTNGAFTSSSTLK